MGGMAKTTKEAKAALSATDPAITDAILQTYVDEAKAEMALVPGRKRERTGSPGSLLGIRRDGRRGAASRQYPGTVQGCLRLAN